MNNFESKLDENTAKVSRIDDELKEFKEKVTNIDNVEKQLNEFKKSNSDLNEKNLKKTNDRINNISSDINQRLDTLQQNLNDLQNDDDISINDNHNKSKKKKKIKLSLSDIYNLNYNEKVNRYKTKNMRSDLTFLEFALNNPHLYILQDTTKSENNYYWQFTSKNLKKNIDNLLTKLNEASIFNSVEILGGKIIKLWFNDNIFINNQTDKKIFAFMIPPNVLNFRNDEYDSCDFIKQFGSKSNEYEIWSIYTESNSKKAEFELYKGRYNGFDNIMKNNNFCYKLLIAIKLNSNSNSDKTMDIDTDNSNTNNNVEDLSDSDDQILDKNQVEIRITDQNGNKTKPNTNSLAMDWDTYFHNLSNGGNNNS